MDLIDTSTLDTKSNVRSRSVRKYALILIQVVCLNTLSQ